MLQNGSNTVKTYNGSWVASSGGWSGSANEVIAPGTNTGGIIIKNFSLSSSQTGPIDRKVSVIAKETPPTSGSDGDVIAVSKGRALLTGGNVLIDCEFTGEVLIPAGKGLYLYDGDANRTHWVGGGIYTKL